MQTVQAFVSTLTLNTICFQLLPQCWRVFQPSSSAIARALHFLCLFSSRCALSLLHHMVAPKPAPVRLPCFGGNLASLALLQFGFIAYHWFHYLLLNTHWLIINSCETPPFDACLICPLLSICCPLLSICCPLLSIFCPLLSICCSPMSSLGQKEGRSPQNGRSQTIHTHTLR